MSAGSKRQPWCSPETATTGFPVELSVSLYRTLPNAELGVCPHADHVAPVTPARASILAAIVRDFAIRHAQAR